jgi:hypothetical protein
MHHDDSCPLTNILGDAAESAVQRSHQHEHVLLGESMLKVQLLQR